jgi:hypothetical protein
MNHTLARRSWSASVLRRFRIGDQSGAEPPHSKTLARWTELQPVHGPNARSEEPGGSS